MVLRWGPTHTGILSLPPSPDIDSPFAMHDLDMALRRLKSKKASGPNEVPGEIYKHAPCILKLYLLARYNQCYPEAKVPPSWLLSEVVMILKNISFVASWKFLNAPEFTFSCFLHRLEQGI